MPNKFIHDYIFKCLNYQCLDKYAGNCFLSITKPELLNIYSHKQFSYSRVELRINSLLSLCNKKNLYLHFMGATNGRINKLYDVNNKWRILIIYFQMVSYLLNRVQEVSLVPIGNRPDGGYYEKYGLSAEQLMQTMNESLLR